MCMMVAGTGVAGYVNGSCSIAQFNGPTAIAVDVAGNIYVADTKHELSKNDIEVLTNAITPILKIAYINQH